MISFDPRVQVKGFFWPFFTVLLNASQWSNLRKVPLCVTAIQERDTFEHADPRIQGRIDLRVESSFAPDTAHLIGYLSKHLPAAFMPSAEGHTVIVLWSCRPAVSATGSWIANT